MHDGALKDYDERAQQAGSSRPNPQVREIVNYI